MSVNQVRNYLLVIRSGRNNYLSIEWDLTDFYNGENLHSLTGIDDFTSKITRVELLQNLLEHNLAEANEQFESFAIIYNVNGKVHEIKEGTLFKEDTQIIGEDELINLIIENISNKAFLNEIFNILNSKEPEQKLTEFRFILKNIDLFEQKGPNAIEAALSTFKDISYEKKRSLLFRISNSIIPKYINERNPVTLTKKDYHSSESKVA